MFQRVAPSVAQAPGPPPALAPRNLQFGGDANFESDRATLTPTAKSKLKARLASRETTIPTRRAGARIICRCLGIMPTQ